MCPPPLGRPLEAAYSAPHLACTHLLDLLCMPSLVTYSTSRSSSMPGVRTLSRRWPTGALGGWSWWRSWSVLQVWNEWQQSSAYMDQGDSACHATSSSVKPWGSGPILRPAPQACCLIQPSACMQGTAHSLRTSSARWTETTQQQAPMVVELVHLLHPAQPLRMRRATTYMIAGITASQPAGWQTRR